MIPELSLCVNGQESGYHNNNHDNDDDDDEDDDDERLDIVPRGFWER